MANANDFYIGANDEHGVDPPTAGKRTPEINTLGRSIYENEFNYPTKNYLIESLYRVGYRVYDVKPERTDIDISTRIVRVNSQNLTSLVTFAFNAYLEEFNSANGYELFYSTYNAESSQSKILSDQMNAKMNTNLNIRNRGVSILNTVSMLSKVSCASSLIEAGFMTNLDNASLMLDPDYQLAVAESACQGVCEYYGVTYISRDSLSSYATIRTGSKNSYVSMAQYMLNSYGYDLSTDGIFGVNTANAVLLWQTRNNITADSIIGPATWSTLLNLDPTTYTIRNGDRSAPVYYLQQKLESKFYPISSIDGIFGSETEKYVKLYQTNNNLTVDGIVGRNTWASILQADTYLSQ